MHKAIALALGVLVSLLGLAGVGSAQSTVQVQGTIQGVDCQSGTVDVATPDSTNTIAVENLRNHRGKRSAYQATGVGIGCVSK